MEKETKREPLKSVTISESVHQALKLHVVSKKISMTDYLDALIKITLKLK